MLNSFREADGAINVIVAHGKSGQVQVQFHSERRYAFKLDPRAVGGGVRTVFSSTRTRIQLLHGMVMASSWSFLTIVGIIVARYRRILFGGMHPTSGQ